jgi:hypothetical protein
VVGQCEVLAVPFLGQNEINVKKKEQKEITYYYYQGHKKGLVDS